MVDLTTALRQDRQAMRQMCGITFGSAVVAGVQMITVDLDGIPQHMTTSNDRAETHADELVEQLFRDGAVGAIDAGDLI